MNRHLPARTGIWVVCLATALTACGAPPPVNPSDIAVADIEESISGTNGPVAAITNSRLDSLTMVDLRQRAFNTVRVGEFPIALAYSPDGNWFATANRGGNSASVVNVSTRKVTTYPAGEEPMAVLAQQGSSNLWVANWKSASITVIDTRTGRIRTVDSGEYPSSLAQSPDGREIYVLNHYLGRVLVLDGQNLQPRTEVRWREFPSCDKEVSIDDLLPFTRMPLDIVRQHVPCLDAALRAYLDSKPICTYSGFEENPEDFDRIYCILQFIPEDEWDIWFSCPAEVISNLLLYWPLYNSSDVPQCGHPNRRGSLESPVQGRYLVVNDTPAGQTLLIDRATHAIFNPFLAADAAQPSKGTHQSHLIAGGTTLIRPGKCPVDGQCLVHRLDLTQEPLDGIFDMDTIEYPCGENCGPIEAVNRNGRFGYRTIYAYRTEGGPYASRIEVINLETGASASKAIALFPLKLAVVDSEGVVIATHGNPLGGISLLDMVSLNTLEYRSGLGLGE